MVKRIEKYFSWGSVGLLLLAITYTLFQLDEEALGMYILLEEFYLLLLLLL